MTAFGIGFVTISLLLLGTAHQPAQSELTQDGWMTTLKQAPALALLAGSRFRIDSSSWLVGRYEYSIDVPISEQT